MDIKDCAEKFLQNDWEEVEIPTKNPESSSVILWRYLKERREKLNDYNDRISIRKTKKSLVLRKCNDMVDESIVTLKDGTKVPLRDLLGTSKRIEEYCNLLMQHVQGTAPSYDETRVPSSKEEMRKITEKWNLSKPDTELCMKTIKEILEYGHNNN